MALVGRKIASGGRPLARNNSGYRFNLANLVSISEDMYTQPPAAPAYTRNKGNFRPNQRITPPEVMTTPKVAIYLMNLTISNGLLVKSEDFNPHDHGWHSYMLAYGMIGFISLSVFMGVLWKIIDILALGESKRFDDAYDSYDYYSSFRDVEINDRYYKKRSLLPDGSDVVWVPRDDEHVILIDGPYQFKNRQFYFKPSASNLATGAGDNVCSCDGCSDQSSSQDDPSSSPISPTAVNSDTTFSQSKQSGREKPPLYDAKIARIFDQHRQKSPLIDKNRVTPLYGSLSNRPANNDNASSDYC